MERSIENQPESLQERNISMDDFRAEIFTLRSKEEAEETGTSHLTKNKGVEQRIDVDKLTTADAVIWEKIKQYPRYGSVSDEEWQKYSEMVVSSGDVYRQQFLSFLANKRSPIRIRELMARENI